MEKAYIKNGYIIKRKYTYKSKCLYATFTFQSKDKREDFNFFLFRHKKSYLYAPIHCPSLDLTTIHPKDEVVCTFEVNKKGYIDLLHLIVLQI